MAWTTGHAEDQLSVAWGTIEHRPTSRTRPWSPGVCNSLAESENDPGRDRDSSPTNKPDDGHRRKSFRTLDRRDVTTAETARTRIRELRHDHRPRGGNKRRTRDARNAATCRVPRPTATGPRLLSAPTCRPSWRPPPWTTSTVSPPPPSAPATPTAPTVRPTCDSCGPPGQIRADIFLRPHLRGRPHPVPATTADQARSHRPEAAKGAINVTVELETLLRVSNDHPR